jgi:type II secretory pathway component PulK
MKVTSRRNRGFALILVLWAVTILSAIVLTFLNDVGAETKSALIERDSIAAEQLALSGQEIISYLATRGLGSTAENLMGTPVTAVTPGFHYKIRLETGTVDAYLESDTGKINLATANLQLVQNFWTNWTQDPNRAAAIASAIVDWRDLDDVTQAGSAEAADYAGLGYQPRNAGLRSADLALIRGLGRPDFEPKVPQGNASVVPSSLSVFITSGPVGTTINPSFAPELILKSVPGLSDTEVQSIKMARKGTVFKTADQFLQATGIDLSQRPELQTYISFGRGNAPAVLTVAELTGSAVRRSVRRVDFAFTSVNRATGRLETSLGLVTMQRDVFPEFLQ